MKTEETSSASQYANALLQLTQAAKKDTDKLILQNLHDLNQAFAKEPELSIFLKHPAILASHKKEFLHKLFSNKIEPLCLNLLKILCEKRLLYLLPHIAGQYQELLNAKNNIVCGTLFCAESLDEQAINNIKHQLAKSINKTLELDVQVDKSLIGGFMLKLGDQVIDGSLKGRLQSIEKSLLSV